MSCQATYTLAASIAAHHLSEVCSPILGTFWPILCTLWLLCIICSLSQKKDLSCMAVGASDERSMRRFSFSDKHSECSNWEFYDHIKPLATPAVKWWQDECLTTPYCQRIWTFLQPLLLFAAGPAAASEAGTSLRNVPHPLAPHTHRAARFCSLASFIQFVCVCFCVFL